MKWAGKVDDKTKEKIELLYKEFDKFIDETHAGNAPEDQMLLRQWSNFKTVIEKNPTDFESMHEYIGKMGDEEAREPVEAKTGRTASPFTAKPEAKLDLNRARLKKLSGEFLTSVNRHTREMFKV